MPSFVCFGKGIYYPHTWKGKWVEILFKIQIQIKIFSTTFIAPPLQSTAFSIFFFLTHCYLKYNRCLLVDFNFNQWDQFPLFWKRVVSKTDSNVSLLPLRFDSIQMCEPCQMCCVFDFGTLGGKGGGSQLCPIWKYV